MQNNDQNIVNMLSTIEKAVDEYVGHPDTHRVVKHYLVELQKQVRQCGGVIPTSFNLFKEDVNNIITKEMGFAGLDDTEAVALGQRIQEFIDWNMAVKRAFWEVVLVNRCGAESHINRKYIHSYDCDKCDVTFETIWYVDPPVCICPTCGQPAVNVESWPAPENDG